MSDSAIILPLALVTLVAVFIYAGWQFWSARKAQQRGEKSQLRQRHEK